MTLGEIKLWNLKKVHFEKRVQKVKKHNNFTVKIGIGFELQGYLFITIIKTRNVKTHKKGGHFKNSENGWLRL